jgi:hypothetical protein
MQKSREALCDIAAGTAVRLAGTPSSTVNARGTLAPAHFEDAAAPSRSAEEALVGALTSLGTPPARCPLLAGGGPAPSESNADPRPRDESGATARRAMEVATQDTGGSKIPTLRNRAFAINDGGPAS